MNSKFVKFVTGPKFTKLLLLMVAVVFTALQNLPVIWASTIISGSGIKLGARILITLTRITATGTAPSNSPYFNQCMIHYEIDKMGSATMTGN